MSRRSSRTSQPWTPSRRTAPTSYRAERWRPMTSVEQREAWLREVASCIVGALYDGCPMTLPPASPNT